MNFGSVCSGIGGAELAFAGLAESAFASEIDAFPRAVLAHRFPGTKLHGDFTTIRDGDYEPIDVLAGGTPCQSFSIAGLRGGLSDERGNLALEYLRLADRLRPCWLLWENVSGVLSSNGGRDFGAFLGGMVKLGYGFAYRVLDAQFFGLAQRRKRVFVVGYLGDWRRAAAVRFEPASLRGDTPPSREAGEGVAGAVAASTGGSDENDAKDGRLIAVQANASGDSYISDTRDLAPTLRHGIGGGSTIPAVAFGGNNAAGPIARCLNAHPSRIDGESETFITHSLRADGFDASEDGTGRGTPLVSVAFHENQGAEVTLNDTAGSLKVGGGKPGQGYPAIHANSGVRRLTPRECERLQGFPDDWTLIPWRKGIAPDGPRYRAIGNAWAVPVVRWIAKRMARKHGEALGLAA